ncbi:MAG: SRPBCC family protein [Xanthomonadales bacterium]|nr:SRPBCC family protein [Xanthomonadales bacterium]
MTQIQRQAIVRRSASFLYDLVNDVRSYPDRFNWCEASTVLDESESGMDAELKLRLGALKTAFTTRNRLFPHERIELNLLAGPFRKLRGEWRFVPLAEQACRVELQLDFDLAGTLVGSALAIGFTGLADRLVDDFCREAMRLQEAARV